MKDTDDLRDELHRIDGRGYKAYKDIKGRWAFPGWTLEVAWVQGDPYASPSRVHAYLPADLVALPDFLLSSRSRRIGLAAHLARTFGARAGQVSSSRGTGRSGVVRMEDPGQKVLEQTAVTVAEDGSVEARFYVGLPARGRRVLGRQAAELLTGDVPRLVGESLRAGAHDPDDLRAAAETNEDADHLRAALAGRDLVAFVADDARLPRRSGVDDRPLDEGVVPFRSPEALRVELELPNRGSVTGMGVPGGVTLIVGGGFHGKSTVLRAMEAGVYNHRPGDGRELVVTEAAAVKIRAEDGRAVTGVDISPFIDGLPFGTDTRAFTTPNASGSTSQAASLVEALEAGATTLLVDEDTAATNFMIRDRRMQELVPGADEPITPFVDRVRDLHDTLGVSSVLVLGGSGDYLDVADTVVAMRDYQPRDVTDQARRVAEDHPTGRTPERGRPMSDRPARIPVPGSIDPSRGRRDVKLKIGGENRLLFGTEEIDLSAVEQIVSWAQVNTLAHALVTARDRFMDGRTSLSRVLDWVMELVEREGLDAVHPWNPGDLTAFRRFELAAMLNRLRTLEITPLEPTAGTEQEVEP